VEKYFKDKTEIAVIQHQDENLGEEPEMLKDSSVAIIKQTRHDNAFKTIDNDEIEERSDDSFERVSDHDRD